MKKILILLLTLVICVTMAACGSPQIPETMPTTQPDLQLSFVDFVEKAAQADLVISYPRVVTWSDGTAFLMTDLVNSTQTTIQSADVYFAAFDILGQPVMLNNNASREFVKAAKLTELSLAPGQTWRANMGLRLTDGFEQIAYVVAIVDKYTDTDQNIVENPLVQTWMTYYNGAALEEYVLLHLQAQDPEGRYEEFVAQVQQQGVVAVLPRTIHEEKTTTLISDLRNDTQQTITGATILFAAFDAEGNPVQLMTSATEDTYVKRLELKDLSVAPGEVWQADMGLRLSGVAEQIAYIQVLCDSWTTEEGKVESDYTDRYLEYFNGTMLQSFMMQ